MGSIQKRRRKDGKDSYRVKYRQPDGTWGSKTFLKRKDATDFERAVETKKREGRYVNPRTDVTVADYTREYLANDKPWLEESTVTRKANYARHVINSPLGGKRLTAVRPSDVDQWVNGLHHAGLKPSTIHNTVGFLSGTFKRAVRDRLIGSNPAEGVARPEVPERHLEVLTPGQVKALADAVGQRRPALEAPVIVMAATGLRTGELLGLRRRDVDLLRAELRVEGQMIAGTRQRKDRLKTKRSRRVVDKLPPYAVTAIAAHLALWPQPDPDGPLFADPKSGGWLSSGVFNPVFRKAVERAGLPPTNRHGLRHRYTSVLKAAAINDFTIARRLGHRNANLIYSTYGHEVPGTDDPSAAVLEADWNSDQDQESELGSRHAVE